MDWNKYPNFSEKEFKCTHTGKCVMDCFFMDKIQAIRTEYGKPMKITSGYRDPSHPVEIKKGTLGEHSMGLSCDVRVRGADALELTRIALKHGIVRIGVSQSGTPSTRYLHLGLGTREQGFMSPWLWSY